MNIRLRAAGGLGNQLLQYFGALFLLQKVGGEIVVDLSEIDRKHVANDFDLRSFSETNQTLKFKEYSRLHPRRVYLKVMRKLAALIPSRLFLTHFVANSHDINEIAEQISQQQGRRGTVEIHGWFADFQYFKSLPENLRQLTLRTPSKRYLNCHEMLSRKTYVAVHMRFGDYMSDPSRYGVLAREYYERAFDVLGASISEDTFVFFSNDNSQISEILEISRMRNVIMVEDDPAFDPAEVMLLMANATKIVVANSTFSYCAALLAAPSTSVVFPRVNKQGEVFISNTPTHWIEVPPNWI